jgi:hypothetical protein
MTGSYVILGPVHCLSCSFCFVLRSDDVVPEGDVDVDEEKRDAQQRDTEQQLPPLPSFRLAAAAAAAAQRGNGNILRAFILEL